jgi:GNAT superfamily N-acetyltransferase
MSIQLPADYAFLIATPSIETYLHLRIVAGLSPKTAESATIGLPNSMYSVQIQHQPSSSTIAMGRVVGDGALFLQIVDIAVDPAHQKKGLGKAIVGTLMAWVQEHIGRDAFVSLSADGEAKNLYKQFGFVETAPASIGMHWSRASC